MTGVEMLIASVLKALKIDKEVVMAQIQDAVTFAKGADARLTRLEHNIASIESKLDSLLDVLVRIESKLDGKLDGTAPAGIGAATEHHDETANYSEPSRLLEDVKHA